MGRRALQRSPNKSVPSPPDYSPVRGLPPLPPPPGSPPSLSAAAAIGTKGLDRVLLERNLEKLLSERGGSNPSTSSEHERTNINVNSDVDQMYDHGECSANINVESHIQQLLIRDETIKSSNLNVDRLIIEGENIMTLKPEIKKLFLDPSNSDSGNNSLGRTDIHHKLIGEGNVPPDEQQESALVHKEVERLLAERGGRDREPLRLTEPSSSLDSWRPQQSESPHDSGHASSMPELAVQPPTPTSPHRKNLSVRFQGASPDVDERPRFPRSRSYSGRSITRPDHDDADSYCSTCSTSSSSDDLTAYQLPPRRAYGGVRISYVPNDALAIARQRQQATQPRSPTKKSIEDKNCTIS